MGSPPFCGLAIWNLCCSRKQWGLEDCTGRLGTGCNALSWESDARSYPALKAAGRRPCGHVAGRAAVGPCGCLLSCPVSSSWVGPVHVHLISSLTPARAACQGGAWSLQTLVFPSFTFRLGVLLKLVCELGTRFIGVHPEDVPCVYLPLKLPMWTLTLNCFSKGGSRTHLH